MKIDELYTMLRLYAQRYGAYTMGDETKMLWWRKLGYLKKDQAQEAFDQLLGSRKEAFGWKSVAMVVESIFPPVGDQEILDQKWQKQQVKDGDMEKRTEMNRCLRDLMTELEERKQKRDERPFDWMGIYADKFIEVWGVEGAKKLLMKMENCQTQRKGEGGQMYDVRIPLNSTGLDFKEKVWDKLRANRVRLSNA